VRAELFRPADPVAVVATATWTPRATSIQTRDPSIGDVDRLLRRLPVVVEGAAFRRPGTHGEVVLQPASVDWFRAALEQRAPELGLAVRFVATDVRNGWDPASNYRTFDEQEQRLAAE
jgi:hypothetical protein